MVMRYLKDAAGEVYGYDDSHQNGFIEMALSSGLTEITGQWPLAITDQENLKNTAFNELQKVTGPSGTVMRCAAACVVLPQEWVDYIKALRAISNGYDTTSTKLPQQPAFPVGS